MDGYSGREEVLTAIRAVAAAGQYLGPEATKVLMNNMKGRQKQGRFIPVLSRRGKEVLELLARGLSSNDIAKQLFISYHTVESHRKNLRTKFGAHNGAELIRMASEKGLL